MTSIHSTTEIRSFHVDVPNEDQAPSAPASPATRWPKPRQEPELFTIEIRAAFRSLRQGRAS